MWSKITNKYSVSDDGQVRNDITMHLLVGEIHHKGYRRINISGKKYFVHRLVAITFIPNPDNKPQVNHKDMNKLNNHVSNLEWMTNEENNRHSFDNGRKSSNQILNKEQVIEVLNLLSTNKYKLREIAELYNVHITTISSLKQGRNLKRLMFNG